MRQKQVYSTNKEDIFNANIMTLELHKAIKQLKNNKSPGVDKIFPKFTKIFGLIANDTCLKLFNQIWNTSVPASWKKVTVIPLPVLKAKKPTEDISSYCPVSLTSMLAKTMERILNDRITWHLENKNLLTLEQVDF